MSWLSVLCGLGLAFMLLIAAQDLRDGSGAGAYWIVQTLSFAIIVCIPAILVRFFRDFARDPLPFGRQQSRRLLVAGILVFIQIVLGLVSPPAPAATISLAGLPLIYSARDGHFIDAGHIFVEELSEVPDGAIVIFSAHGVSQAVRQEAKDRNLKVFDEIGRAHV